MVSVYGNPKMIFEKDLMRDVTLVKAGMEGGFEAVNMTAMMLYPETFHGPDDVLAHAEWLKKDETYVTEISNWIAAHERR